ncbi:MAG: aminotransferase class V-fold PLP-dependent enzyme [Deltaproteobacteria bacterium]|jgi:aspartate aminotransferase-like enzyme|nr:aminotransferase class V-fold PLP-dependent enzyme [Deltaproteobacteria bacterium]
MYAPIPMVPGPVTLHPDVIAAMGRDYGSGQVDADFLPLYYATSRNLARLLGTRGDVVLMTGEGMLALWGALKSTLKPGDAVVSVGTGVFGDGIGDMAASLGCRVEKISLPYNHTLDSADLERIAQAVRRVRPLMLTAVHCETPSGTLNPLAELGRLKADLHVPLLYVDAVASVGGVPVCADDWHIDLVLGGSQKCLAAPPSMAFVGVSDAAWERMAAVNYQGYDAILPFRTVYQDGRCPYTPYWHGVSALHAAALAIFREGLDEVFARHERAAARCRDGLAKLGIRLWTESHAVNAPTVTAALIPAGRDWSAWQKALSDRGLIVAGSFGPMAGKVFRIGHMGTQAQLHLVDMALEAVGDALERN